MSKITLNRVASLINAPTALNGIISQIESAFDRVLFRDGTTPNQMSADLDMNNKRIYNLPAPQSSNDPVRLQDIVPTVNGISISDNLLAHLMTLTVAATNTISYTLPASVTIDGTPPNQTLTFNIPQAYGLGTLQSVTGKPPAGRWSLPSGFNDQIGGSVPVYDGTTWKFETSRYDAIDFTKWKTATNYYVDYVSGSDSNDGLSSGAAVKTFDYVSTLIAALSLGSAVIINCLNDYVGYLSRTTLISSAFDGMYVKVVGKGPSGRTRFVVMREDKTQAVFSWVAHGSNGAWKSNVAGAAGNYTGQFFTGQLDSLGLPTPIVSTGQNSSTVDSTELTSYWDGTYLYVHLPHGIKPDPFNNWIYNSNNGGHEFQQDSGALLFENCDFMGGSNGVAKNAFRFRPKNSVVTPSTSSVGFKNGKFYGASANGMGIYDAAIVVTENCAGGYCFNDIFNIHSFNNTGALGTGITYYEENARGHDAGYQGFAYGLTPSGSDNISTVHDGASVLRVNSSGWNVRDCAFVDVGGADSVNFGVFSPKNNNGTGGTYPMSINYEANTGAGLRRRMVLIGCSGSDDMASTYAIGNTGTATDARIHIAYWQGKPNVALKAGVGAMINYLTGASLYAGPP